MLRGIIPSMVTPFNERDEVDEKGLRSVAHQQRLNGRHSTSFRDEL